MSTSFFTIDIPTIRIYRTLRHCYRPWSAPPIPASHGSGPRQ
jgi:hypothetical protein